MSRISISTLTALSLLVASFDASHGFFVRGPSRPSTVSLFARYTPKVVQPPPPPPPPPPPVEPEPTGPLDSIVKEISSALDGLFPNVDLPSLPSLPLPSGVELPDLSKALAQVQGLDDLRAQIQSLDAGTVAQLDALVKDLKVNLASTANPTTLAVVHKLQTILSPVVQSSSIAFVLSAGLAFASVSTILQEGPPPSQPYPMGRYDPIAARAYFDRRPFLVIARGLEIMVQSLKFGLTLLQDYATDSLEETEYERGRELATLLTQLGPTFIKVGQSLSIRTDLLSPAYIRGLATLQDQVPPFDTAVAQQILQSEWGRPVTQVVNSFPNAPIAAASLGQVYKCTLKENGQEVAIKVQRPNIMNQIALDMHLLREMAGIAKRLFNLNTDTVGTVDAWGSGFVDELDYIQEAKNAENFSAQVAQTPLSDVVLAPAVVNQYSSESVLVSEWIDGQRLDKSAAGDVTVLCSIAMNTYLTMLLEMGLLHCDPHPGNLLRTPEGRLCILDWGMVTRLDGDLQLTLIEHMAHLTSADYDEIPRDLLLLGFIPEAKAGLIQDSGLVEVLADIYGAWTKGGGVAAFNVNDVINQLQDLTAEKGNLFQIPPYFAYIAKSFSVLEGIGLSNDPKYSIINECLPYVSKRLLTDDDKCGPALSTFIFGPEKNNANRFVDYDRVEQLVEGFGEYTTSASGALLGKDNSTRVELIESSADEILDLVFAEAETPLQEIMLEQAAKIMASTGRSVFTQIRERSGVLPTGRTVLGTVLDPLGIFRSSPLVRMNDLDEQTLETTEKLVKLAEKQLAESPNPLFDLSDLSREEQVALTSILVRKMWQRRSGVVQTSNRFVRQLITLTAEGLEIGERDTRRLPPAPESTSSESDSSDDSSSSSSLRLDEARRLLKSFQGREQEATLEPLPVRTRL